MRTWLGWVIALALAVTVLAMRHRPRRTSFPVRSEPELQAGITHIAYEWIAFLQAMTRIPPNPTDARWDDLEVVLLHARNLIDFFWPETGRRRAHPDGIYAVHYVADWPGARSLPTRPSELYSALSAQLAHISVRRTQPNVVRDFEVEIHQLAADLTVTRNAWFAALAGSDWESRIGAAEAASKTRIG